MFVCVCVPMYAVALGNGKATAQSSLRDLNVQLPEMTSYYIFYGKHDNVIIKGTSGARLFAYPGK